MQRLHRRGGNFPSSEEGRWHRILFLFTGKLFVGTFAENFKVIEAESFGICHLCTEIHIFLYMEKKVFM